jgi:integrative and conjugative element protein (TIGR02256 family)
VQGSAEMRFQRPQGGIVEFSPDAVTTLRSYRQVGLFSLEAGGMLLGRLILGGNDVVVDSASEPAPEDRRARYWFRRARRPAQTVVDRVWRESNGVVNYLGEWHSHPERIPSPSCIDRRDWRRVSRLTKSEADHLLFVIVGTEAIRIWQVARRGSVIETLEIATDTFGTGGNNNR